MIVTFENCKVGEIVKSKKNENHYSNVSEPYSRADLNLSFKSYPTDLKVNVETKLTLIGQLGSYNGKYFFAVESFKQG